MWVYSYYFSAYKTKNLNIYYITWQKVVLLQISVQIMVVLWVQGYLGFLGLPSIVTPKTIQCTAI
jgi:hypothetical protein